MLDCVTYLFLFFFFSSRRRHTRLQGDWSSDVCSSDLVLFGLLGEFRSVPGREERKFVADLARRLERAAGSRPSKERRCLPGIRKRIRTLLREIPHSSPGSAATAGDAMEIGRASCRERV